MNPKKANWLFLSTLVFEAVVMIALVFYAAKWKINVMESLVLSQMILLLPTVLFLLATRTNPFKLIQHKGIRISTAFMVVGFALLSMPLILLVNMISLLFVENTVTDVLGMITSVPAALAAFVIGVLGPANEEFVFRGVIYHSYRRDGRFWGAMFLSAFLFGLTHLNFNQMSYAILVGVLGVLLVECTGSIFSSMIFHMVINLSNVIPVFFSPESFANADSAVESQLASMGVTYKEYLYMAIGVYGVIALIATSLAACLLYAIAQREGRGLYMKRLLRRHSAKRAGSLLSMPLIISIVICFAVMTIDVLTSG